MTNQSIHSKNYTRKKTSNKNWKSVSKPTIHLLNDWQSISALSISALIIALNLSFPDLSDTSNLSLSTYQTRTPTIQFEYPLPKFVHLSYLNPLTGNYFKGNDDIYFVGFMILIWLSLRKIIMQFFWKPLASLLGLTSQNKLERFAEQGWAWSYWLIFCSIGIKILSGFQHPLLSLNIRQYWLDYPNDSLPALTKFYYLSQTAFWFQQLIVLHIEKPRKDHNYMLLHHLVTIFLLSASYATNLTSLGTLIQTTMDFSDIFLCLGKMLTYLKAGWLADSTFLCFVLSWIYTRHYVFIRIIYAIAFDLPKDLVFEWRPHEGYFGSQKLWLTFLIILIVLQFLLIFWFSIILKVLYKVIIGQGTRDSRSDTEDSNEDELPPKNLKNSNFNEKQPLLHNS